jgi:HlyD family secretion protein
VREHYPITAPVSGRLVPVDHDVGDAVRAGDVIARIHPLPLDERARAEAVARLDAAQAAAHAAAAVVAELDAAWAQAERDLARIAPLGRDSMIAPQLIDQAQTRARVAAAVLEAARGRAEAATHEVEAARGALLGTEHGAQATPVRAPAGGRILRLHEQRERAIAAGEPIAELGDPADLEVVVPVLTDQVGRIREGDAALVSTAAAHDTLAGRVLRIEPSAFTKVSPLGVEEQRVNVVVALESPGHRLGDRFRVDVDLIVWSSERVLAVPVSTLFRDGERWAVFVLEEGRARLRSIELGERGERAAEVRAGLAEGERVILYPGSSVDDGVRVEGAEVGR